VRSFERRVIHLVETGSSPLSMGGGEQDNQSLLRAKVSTEREGGNLLTSEKRGVRSLKKKDGGELGPILAEKKNLFLEKEKRGLAGEKEREGNAEGIKGRRKSCSPGRGESE